MNHLSEESLIFMRHKVKIAKNMERYANICFDCHLNKNRALDGTHFAASLQLKPDIK